MDIKCQLGNAAKKYVLLRYQWISESANLYKQLKYVMIVRRSHDVNQCLYFFLITMLIGTIPNQMYCAIFRSMNDTKIERENTAGIERRFTITPLTKSG